MPIENVQDTLENCRYCLMCRHTAPVMHVTNIETHSPHGLGLVIQSQKRRVIGWDDETIDALYGGDADDGVARANCVTDQPYSSAIAAVRAEVAAHNLAPQVVYDTHNLLTQFGNPYGEPVEQSAVGKADVALFVGDDVHFLRPGIMDAVLALLNAAGIEPVLIGAGRNNGLLASSLGFPETAKALVKATFDDVGTAGAKTLLVMSPADYYAFGKMNEDRLGVEAPDGMILREVLDVLAEQIESGNLSGSSVSSELGTYAYLDPTQAVHSNDRHDIPRKLLETVLGTAGVELFWRRWRAHPSGHTALQFTHPEVAEKLTRDRLEDAKNVGAAALITEAAGDFYHLSQYASEYEINIVSLYEMLAQQIVGISTSNAAADH